MTYEEAPNRLAGHGSGQMLEKDCPICAGIEYVCAKCGKPITGHTHENDYLCDKCSFTSAIKRCLGP